MHRRSLLALAPLAAAGLPARPAAAFPDRAVTLVVGFSPGGSTDIASRLIAERLGPLLGPNGRVVVENRAGASGIVASDWLRRQTPDGHVIMLVESSSHAIAPHALAGGTRYDPVADYTHLAIVGTAPLVLVANPAFPGANAEEVIARLRAAPADSVVYATSGAGTIPHLAAEMLSLRFGGPGRFIHVTYRSGGEMLQSIARGDAAFGIAVLASAAGQVRDGLVRGLAVTSRERFPSFPEIPSLAEGALPDFELNTWNVILGPRGMPAPVVETLNRALVTALADPGLRQRLLTAGVNVWTGSNTPADARAFIAAESAKFADLVRRTGVRLEP